MLSIISRSDKQLVHRVLSGKHEEFNILINRYLSSVYAVAYSRCSHHMDAEDITQDAFINAYQSLDQLR